MSEVADFLIQLISAGDVSEQKPDITRTKWITEQLQNIGCKCDFKVFDDTANVYAEIGNSESKNNLCFCGHCDVVPAKRWTRKPLGEIAGDKVYGRGAVDMLGAIACWFIALKQFKEKNKSNLDLLFKNTKITTLLTGDEEGSGLNGTKKMVNYLIGNGEKIDACIVGEPTSDYSDSLCCAKNIDDAKLNGICYSRGGSLHFWIKVNGRSGHVAYVGEFDNPITKAAKLCNELKQISFKEFGDMTNLEIISFDANNDTDNVILDDVNLHGNVRFFYDFCKKKTSEVESLIRNKIENVCTKILQKNFKINYQCDRIGYTTSCENDFLLLAMRCMKKYNSDSKFVVVRACTDGEYMKNISNSVCEIGLKCKMMHKIDEYTTIQDLESLINIYEDIITEYLNSFAKSD